MITQKTPITFRKLIAVSLLTALPLALAEDEAPKELAPKAESLESYNSRMQWFVDSPYGMFIHFGLYRDSPVALPATRTKKNHFLS